MQKDGLCFTCKKKGHIAKDCPDKLESNSIRIVTTNSKVSKPTRVKPSKTDGRSYSEVVSGKPQSKVSVPTISVSGDGEANEISKPLP